MTRILGLTGSIGMGKSTTAQMFRDAGVPVHDADATVHALYAGEAALLIEAAFPGTVEHGAVDRAKLGAAVLGKADAMAALEHLIHPLVHKAEQAFMAEHADAPLIVIDVPLLLETGGEGRVNAIAVVTAPYEVQRMRVLARSGMSEDKFAAILARQVPDEAKRAQADYIIDTSNGLDAARMAVADIIEQEKAK